MLWLVMSRLMLQPYCDGLRVVRGSGDHCRGGVSACAKPDLDGLPVAQSSRRSSSAWRHPKYWRATLRPYAGDEGLSRVPVHDVVLWLLGGRRGERLPGNTCGSEESAAIDPRDCVWSRPAMTDRRFRRVQFGRQPRQIDGSGAHGSEDRRLVLCAFLNRQWVPRRPGLVGHDGRGARQAPSDRSRRRALSCTVLVAGREGDEFGDLRPSKDENP
jgi:hypothetical protein